jgi:hypothetical protein
LKETGVFYNQHKVTNCITYKDNISKTIEHRI